MAVDVNELGKPIRDKVKDFLKGKKGKDFTLEEMVEKLELSEKEGSF